MALVSTQSGRLPRAPGRGSPPFRPADLGARGTAQSPHRRHSYIRPPAAVVRPSRLAVNGTWGWGVRSRGIGGSGPPAVEARRFVVISDQEGRALHASAPSPRCWCDGLDGEQFRLTLFHRCLRPRGFEMTNFYTGPELKITGGPGIDEGRDRRARGRGPQQPVERRAKFDMEERGVSDGTTVCHQISAPQELRKSRLSQYHRDGCAVITRAERGQWGGPCDQPPTVRPAGVPMDAGRVACRVLSPATATGRRVQPIPKTDR